MYKIKDITDQSGKVTLNLEYAKALGLTGEEEILDEKCIDGGNDYNKTYECLLESGDTFMYCTAGSKGFFVLGYPKLIKKSSKQAYANKVKSLVKEYRKYFNLNVGIGLTLGINSNVYNYIKDRVPFTVSNSQYHALTQCGIDRRTDAIVEILGTDEIEELYITSLGQTGTTRLADLIIWNQRK